MSCCCKFTWLLGSLMGTEQSGACLLQEAQSSHRQAKPPCPPVHSNTRWRWASHPSQGPGKSGRGQAEGAAGFIKTRTAWQKERSSALASEVFTRELAYIFLRSFLTPQPTVTWMCLHLHHFRDMVKFLPTKVRVKPLSSLTAQQHWPVQSPMLALPRSLSISPAQQ